MFFLAFSCLQASRVVVVCYSKRRVIDFPRFSTDSDAYSLNQPGKKIRFRMDK